MLELNTGALSIATRAFSLFPPRTQHTTIHGFDTPISP